MSEHQYDWNRVALLLHVAQELRNYPKFDRMNQAVMAELQDICDEPVKKQEGEAPRPEPVVDEASHVEDEQANKKETVKVDPLDAPIEEVQPPATPEIERRV
jgi:hypothetical protein